MDMMGQGSGRLVVALALAVWVPVVLAQVTFYEHEDFRGRHFTTPKRMGNLERAGFNDSASSVVVERQSWAVCEDSHGDGERARCCRQGGVRSVQRAEVVACSRGLS